MAAGGPGDHPLSDILQYDIEVYGPEADTLIKKLAHLLSRRELWEWWEREIGWDCKPQDALVRISKELEHAETRARDSGWEV